MPTTDLGALLDAIIGLEATSATPSPLRAEFQREWAGLAEKEKAVFIRQLEAATRHANPNVATPASHRAQLFRALVPRATPTRPATSSLEDVVRVMTEYDALLTRVAELVAAIRSAPAAAAAAAPEHRELVDILGKIKSYELVGLRPLVADPDNFAILANAARMAAAAREGGSKRRSNRRK